VPKMKTHKGAKARYGVTGTGKLVRMKRGSSHLRLKKTKAVRGTYDAKQLVDDSQRRRVLTLIPAFNK
jgi:large subunit ribosomal protein L35